MTVTPSQFVAVAKSLGNGRKYVLDTTGPDSYDCSGLVYRTLVNLGIYDGPRFSTRDFASLSSEIASRVSPPAVGDIVLWAAHMGIVDGPNTFYSAYSPARGILDTSLSGFPRTPGFPRYYRLNAYAPTISVGSHSGVPVPISFPTPTNSAPPISLTQEDEMLLIRDNSTGAVVLLSGGRVIAVLGPDYAAYQGAGVRVVGVSHDGFLAVRA